MAKSLSLQEFRAELESEALKKCKAQEETIRKLHAQIHLLENQAGNQATQLVKYANEVNSLISKKSRLWKMIYSKDLKLRSARVVG
jgi:cell division protein FtsL